MERDEVGVVCFVLVCTENGGAMGQLPTELLMLIAEHMKSPIR
jgi:hypothetical protein